MPLYDVRCGTCGAVQEVFRSYEERDTDLPVCCGAPMPRAFLPPQVMRDITDYRSMITGEMITSRSQHREHLKRHNMIEMGNEKPNLERRGVTIPRESIHREMHQVVERMKAQGTFREH